MTRLYKTKRKVIAYPNLRRLYQNNCKKLKYHYCKLENITLYQQFCRTNPDKQSINEIIENLIDIQLAIRDSAYQLIDQDKFYKKERLTKRMKGNYITAVSLALESKV